MSFPRLAYVGSLEATLTLVLMDRGMTVGFDLGIPQAMFTLSSEVGPDEDRAQAYLAMADALIEQVAQFLLVQGVPESDVVGFVAMANMAKEDISTNDRLGRGGSADTLLNHIAESEPADTFEKVFEIPETLIHGLHQHVVTGSLPTVRSKPGYKPPPNFIKNPVKVRTQAPSVRNLINKFKGQQNKKVTGPMYVMVYDAQGRPVAVRSIKGPGWKWASDLIAEATIQNGDAHEV